MNKEQLIFFGITFILFILLQPNLFVKIPIKYSMCFIMFHCLVFTMFYLITYNCIFNVQENFTDDETKLFIQKRDEIAKAFKTIDANDLEKMSDEKIKDIMNNITKGLNDEEIKKLQQFLLSNTAHNEQTIYKQTSLTKNKAKNLAEKIDYLGNFATVEQIKFFDSLSVNQQDALGRILENMSNSEIEQYLKLDVEKLKKTIQEVLENV